MNPLMLYRSLPYIVIIVLAIALAWTSNLYLDKRDQYAALTASVAALGEAAKANVEKIQKQSVINLQTVKENHEKLAVSIRMDAVRNYVAHRAADRVRDVRSSCGAMPGDAPGEPLHDDTLSEPLLDIALIEEAASDANKLAAWQEWCQLNHCPIRN